MLLVQYPQCLRWGCNHEAITIDELLQKEAIAEAGITEDDIQKVIDYERAIGEGRTNQFMANS